MTIVCRLWQLFPVGCSFHKRRAAATHSKRRYHSQVSGKGSVSNTASLALNSGKWIPRLPWENQQKRKKECKTPFWTNLETFYIFNKFLFANQPQKRKEPNKAKVTKPPQRAAGIKTNTQGARRGRGTKKGHKLCYLNVRHQIEGNMGGCLVLDGLSVCQYGLVEGSQYFFLLGFYIINEDIGHI